jgi:hypothetical protein
MSKLIIELPIINEKFEILQESRFGDFDTVRFKALLMEADTVNRNKRIYPRRVLEQAIESVKGMMEKRNFGGELDHPLPTGTQADIYRQQTLFYKEMSHIITEMWWEGNKVYGIVETTPTPNGQILANLVRFGVQVGFSLRALGDVKPRSDGINEVVGPIMLVAIDAVQNPSFQRAVITELVQESAILTESAILENTNKFCTMDGICFDSLEELVEWKLFQRLVD